MRSIQLNYPSVERDFQLASRLASAAARKEQMLEPTIMAWHEQGSEAISPRFDGGNPDGWWGKYGEGNGGRLEIDVGDHYQFVMMDTRGFETLGPMPVRSLTGKDGQEYLCMTALLGSATQPNGEACLPLDDWWADQY